MNIFNIFCIIYKEVSMLSFQRRVFFSFFFIGLFMLTETARAQVLSLEQAVQTAAKDIERSMKAGTKVAVINFRSPKEDFAEYVIEELAIALVNGKKLV
jgi:hypothetical protein